MKTKGVQAKLTGLKMRSSNKVFVFVDAQGSERERERETNSMYKLWNHITVESKKELI